MKSLFENKCVYTQEILTEMARATQKISSQIYSAIFLVLFIGLGILNWVIEGFSLFPVLFFLAAVFLGFLYYKIPAKEARSLYQHHQQRYHTAVETEVSFADREFILYNKQSGGRVSCLYDQVVRVRETKHLCILMMPKNLAILVDKTGFTKGEWTEFRAFIRQKTGK